jgi:hypothetical protein
MRAERRNDYLIYAVIGILSLSVSIISSDLWFILGTGREIVQTGSIPRTEFLTFHSDFHMIAQQWLFSVIAYAVHEVLGGLGSYLLSVAMMVLLGIVCDSRLKRAGLPWGARLAAAFVAMGSQFYANNMSRPGGLSTPLLVGEAIAMDIVMEKSVAEGDWRRLPASVAPQVAITFVLSALLSNIHASMAMLIWCVCGAYAFASLPFVSRILRGPDAGWKPFASSCACLVAAVIGSFANPYGAEAVFYVVGSFSPYINMQVGEMGSPFPWSPYYSQSDVLFSPLAIIIVSLVLLAFIIRSWIRDKPPSKPWNLFLFLGMLVLAFQHNKGCGTLGTLGVGSLLLLIPIDWERIPHPHARKVRMLSVAAAVLMIAVPNIMFGNIIRFVSYANGIIACDEAGKIIAEDPDYHAGSTAYVPYSGAYVRYRYGILIHNDTRAEMGLKSKNGVYDAYEEKHLANYATNPDGAVDAAAKMIEHWKFDYIAVPDVDAAYDAIAEGAGGLHGKYELIGEYRWQEPAAELGGSIALTCPKWHYYVFKRVS